MSHAKALVSDDFDALVLGSDLPVVVDFYGTWCPPCKALAPILDRMAGEFEGKVKVYKVNTDEETSLAERYQIYALPTLCFFRGGDLVERVEGAPSEGELRATMKSVAGAAS